jgi:transcriptional regulator with XRE-family HTH domain
LPEDVGRRIAEIRLANGWTQEECAGRLEMTVRRLRRFEAGANVTLRTLERIAAALEVSARALLEPPSSPAQPGPGRPRRTPEAPAPGYRRPEEGPPLVLHERTVQRKRRRKTSD